MLTVENLSYDVFDTRKKETILKNINFSLNDGELLVITGPNGGGKSTLAKVLMGINTASSGKIMLDDTDITNFSVDQRAKAGIGFAFQQPARFKGMTVRRLLSLAAHKSISEADCCDLLSSVGLCAQDYIDREVDQTLSGGEMKRVEIATVFAGEHKLCIFDEPEAGIDLWSFSMLVRQFEKIHREKSHGIIIISHQERIINMADRILVISDGQVEAHGTRDELMPSLMCEASDSCHCREERGGDMV